MLSLGYVLFHCLLESCVGKRESSQFNVHNRHHRILQIVHYRNDVWWYEFFFLLDQGVSDFEVLICFGTVWILVFNTNTPNYLSQNQVRLFVRFTRKSVVSTCTLGRGNNDLRSLLAKIDQQKHAHNILHEKERIRHSQNAYTISASVLFQDTLR